MAVIFSPVSAAAGESRAYANLERLTRFGNRHAGAPKRAEAINRLSRQMELSGLAVTRTDFTAQDPKNGRTWAMSNLKGSFRPQSACRLILGSHFDTRHAAEEDPDPERKSRPIEGANDGTSGLAVLLALSKRLPELLPPGVGADVMFFDGEEMGYPGVGGYCAGSRKFAASLGKLKSKPQFGIILDMVCSPTGIFKREPRSVAAHGALVDSLWRQGQGLSPEAFSDEFSVGILDDHAPLTEAGVPSILLIDFDYPHWHRSSDTLERCDRGRLDLVEEALARFLRSDARRFMDCAPPKS